MATGLAMCVGELVRQLNENYFDGKRRFLTEQLPGHGTVYLSQTLKFIRPVFPGQLVTTSVRVTHIEYSKRCVTLDCECKVNGKVVLAGEALVLAPSRKLTRKKNVGF